MFSCALPNLEERRQILSESRVNQYGMLRNFCIKVPMYLSRISRCSFLLLTVLWRGKQLKLYNNLCIVLLDVDGQVEVDPLIKFKVRIA